MNESAAAAQAVTAEEVLRVAELANLELTADEVPRMQHDLNAVLGYIAQLNELDTGGVEPMTQVCDVPGQMLGGAVQAQGQTLRRDAVSPSLDRAEVMVSAPETDGRFYKVPRVIER